MAAAIAAAFLCGPGWNLLSDNWHGGFRFFNKRRELDSHCAGNAKQGIECGLAEFVFHSADHTVRESRTFGDGVHGQAQTFALPTKEANHC